MIFCQMNSTCRLENVKTKADQLRCLKINVYYVDYFCRYLSTSGRPCYCCGMIFNYVEQGDICTKLCLKKADEDPTYGQHRIIKLPSNFGVFPRKILLENGTELNVTEENVLLTFNPRPIPNVSHWRGITIFSSISMTIIVAVAVLKKRKRKTVKTYDDLSNNNDNDS